MFLFPHVVFLALTTGVVGCVAQIISFVFLYFSFPFKGVDTFSFFFSVLFAFRLHFFAVFVLYLGKN